MAYGFRHGHLDISGSVASDDISYMDDSDTLIDFGSDRIKLKTNNTSRLEVGNNRISIKDQLVVGSVDVGTWALTPPSEDVLHVQDGTVVFQRNSADAFGLTLAFNKSRNATDGSNTIVQDNDAIGYIHFMGNDGAGYEELACIQASVDGTPGSDDMPGRLEFSTTPDGDNEVVERMRIDSTGKVGIGTTNPTNKLHVYGNSSNEYVALIDNDQSGQGHVLKISSDGVGTDTDIFLAESGNGTVFKIRGDGRVGIGVATPGSTLSVDDEIAVGEKLIHRGDPDTYLQFPGQNQLNLVANGHSFLKYDGDILINNANRDRDTKIMADNGNVVLHVDAGTNRVGIGTTSPGSGLHVDDSISLPTGGSPKTSNYSLAADDFCIVADCNSSAFTVTLPSATDAMAGRIYTIKRMDSGNSGGGNILTISRNGKNIDNIAGDLALANLDAITLQCIGATGGWIRTAEFKAPLP